MAQSELAHDAIETALLAVDGVARKLQFELKDGIRNALRMRTYRSKYEALPKKW